MVILFDQFNLPDNVFKIIFATEQQILVGRLLFSYIKKNDGEITKTGMGVFAMRLHEEGIVVKEKEKGPLAKEIKITYNKRQFYDRILTPMRGMGLIEYDLYRKVYRLSDKFNRLMIKVGLMWLRELDKN
ncbi:hypothetical protein GOV03_02155 [Candidatus Woesearchaeota archaeon]|nr:hypothetical protein [Candidatus Woesearchaeota archaeon]